MENKHGNMQHEILAITDINTLEKEGSALLGQRQDFVGQVIAIDDIINEA